MAIRHKWAHRRFLQLRSSRETPMGRVATNVRRPTDEAPTSPPTRSSVSTTSHVDRRRHPREGVDDRQDADLPAIKDFEGEGLEMQGIVRRWLGDRGFGFIEPA